MQEAMGTLFKNCEERQHFTVVGSTVSLISELTFELVRLWATPAICLISQFSVVSWNFEDQVLFYLRFFLFLLESMFSSTLTFAHHSRTGRGHLGQRLKVSGVHLHSSCKPAKALGPQTGKKNCLCLWTFLSGLSGPMLLIAHCQGHSEPLLAPSWFQIQS